MTYTTCHTARFPRENTDAFHPLETCARTALARLARQTGRTKTFYATKLIEENIEDLEDRYLAEARLENRGKRYSTTQARRQLGLDN